MKGETLGIRGTDSWSALSRSSCLSRLFGLPCWMDKPTRPTKNQMPERSERPGVNGKRRELTEGDAAKSGWWLGRLLEERGDQLQNLFRTVETPLVGQFLSVQFG